ncbi:MULTISPECIES: beta-class carbonic anhydrase [Bacillus]|uniref:carbonic anhydrase n=2 Tax=Bacillus TaxID=1386 RepID=A0A0M4GBG3_9BACI|nr:MULTISPECIES: carbonic anhydrase [Bacillus]ALC83065.1 carbonic anhydrase [Bacillus gobiensis]MBP1082108.1 carbonic anhydrase [Bacillus capparidis]MED1096732.1 carbonic anhydrase [Bacillus capparidis]
MSIIQKITEFNNSFVNQKNYEAFQTSKFPDKKIVILTCMDTRLLELLPKAMGLKNGDAKIIKNAGAVVSHPFGSIMRSILVAIYGLKAEEVCVIGHRGCGMEGLEPGSILDSAKQNGVSEDRIDTLVNAGINVSEWLTGFECVEKNVENSVHLIKNHPLMPENISVHGMVICPETGKLDLITDGYKQANSKKSNPVTM